MDALLAFFQTFNENIVVLDCNGLRDVLFIIDPIWFKKRPDISENWVIRFNSISRLYKLMIGYYHERISPFTEYLEKPNLTKIAREGDQSELYKFGVLILALAVQSTQKAVFVAKIQGLPEHTQAALMDAVKSIVEKLKKPADKSGLLQEYQKMPLQPVTSQIWKLEGRTKQFSVLSAENEALKDENQRLLDLLQGGHTFQADAELKAQISLLKVQLQAAIDEKDVLLKENINQMQTIDIFNQKLKDFEAKEMSSKNSIDYKQLLDNLRDAEAQIEVFKRKSEDFEVIRRNYTELQDALEKSKELNEILESNLKALESNSEDHSHIIERTFEMRPNEVTTNLERESNNQTSTTHAKPAELTKSDLLQKAQIKTDTFSGEKSMEVITSLRQELQEKELQLSQSLQQIQHIKTSTKREQRLMMSAWYELGLQFQRELPAASGPMSWLAQQRQAMSQSAKRGF